MEGSAAASYVIDVLSTIMAVEYMDHGFEKKYSGAARIMLFAGGCTAYYGIMALLNRHAAFEGGLGISYGVVLAAYGFIALNGKMQRILVHSFLWVLVAISSSYMMYGAMGIITGSSLNTLLVMDRKAVVFPMLAGCALKFSMGRAALALYGQKKGMGQAEDGMLAGTFFCMFILILGMFLLEEGRLDQRGRYFLSLCMLAGILGVIVLIGSFYHRLEQYRREQCETEFRRETRFQQEEQIKDLYRMGREVNHLRHDMKGRLNVLYRLVTKERYGEAADYIERMGADLGNYPELPQDTGNEGLNAALIKAVQECREKGIRFRYVVMGRQDRIDSMDMGTLLYNLISNGIEACMEAGTGRELELVVREEEGTTEIFMENTISGSVIMDNPNLESRKPEDRYHGFGMETIRGIVDKYQGCYSYREETGRFIQEINLREVSE
ncbi:hypothetical protein CBFG_03533 [Clostridiales bacterium 1_7_47FAA]|uniref:GHKL domain-containing protein n=1 Tax=Enterocloster hominis (ex Hitch et al. 2024) TaxID=1917870 RepID=A0ABV1DAX0_9FIRM|nr:hypothetical protein CBFG_03533 [Clostridiales bacterium 1_7_47FAA]